MSDEPPTLLRSSAWCGEAAQAETSAQSLAWGSTRNVPKGTVMLAPKKLDLADWRDPRVGWGLVLPDSPDLDAADRASGGDAPEAIRALLEARGNAPVFRYRADLGEGKLRRYAPDGSAIDLSARGERGLGPRAVPYYLLICASPQEVPWSMQYRLQSDAFVGRLDLDAAGLERYVEALLGDWDGSPRDVSRPVVWAVDHGHPDITWLMRHSIAEQLRKRFEGDADFDVREGVHCDAAATNATLRTTLAERRPAFVATSSHGAILPLDDGERMLTRLGLPVDHDHTLLDAGALTSEWTGHGAIWYAHACCSAGCDSTSRFSGIVDSDTSLGRTLTALEHAGASTAPLPRALLGGRNPLGAFIGHVEPTFDWTLRDPTNGQVTTHHIVNALYSQLHLESRPPVGYAMRVYFSAIAGLLLDYFTASDALHLPNGRERTLRAKLLAFDRMSMVVLGDPTVRLPPSA